MHIDWFVIAGSLFATALNIAMAIRSYRRVQLMDRMEQDYDSLVGFAVMFASAPDGVFPDELRKLAKAVLPASVQYSASWVNVPDFPRSKVLH